MRLSIIVAMGKRGQIGKDNKLLWHLSSDLKNFKKLTTGHAILMGRKTYQSIGRPLPNRNNIIISSQPHLQIEGAHVVNSLEQGIDLAQSFGENELFIIGGGAVYRDTIDLVDRLYLTRVEYDGVADCFFPPFDVSSFDIIEKVDFGDQVRFEILERRS